jgi:hypothetical protein
VHPIAIQELFASILDIVHPPIPVGSEPQDVRVDFNNCITAHGSFNPADPGDVLLAVRGRINGNVSVPGAFSVNQWSFGPTLVCNTAPSAQPNTFEVQADYRPNGGMFAQTDWMPRMFNALPHIAVVKQGKWGALPRYYRMDLHSSSGRADDLYGLYGGGLLQRASVLLAYDPSGSSEQEKVYRASGLPDHLGHWRLRLYWALSRVVAELTYVQVTTRRVLPAIVFSAQRWNPHRGNRFSICGTPDRSRDAWLVGRTIEVRPA